MKATLQTLFADVKVLVIVVFAGVWISSFAIAYWVIPKIDGESALKDSCGARVEGLLNALYFSIVTATTLGYGDVSPSGWLRGCAAVEVTGGVLLAGLAVSAFVALPSQQTRKATKSCTGWWCERVVLPDAIFYSFTRMVRDGDTLQKTGHNYQPAPLGCDSMDRTWFTGTVITHYFPTLLSIYENSRDSPAYTKGVYRFDMSKSLNGRYLYYTGYCYDGKYGCRDSITGRKILNRSDRRKAEAGTLTDTDRRRIVAELFPSEPADDRVDPPA